MLQCTHSAVLRNRAGVTLTTEDFPSPLTPPSSLAGRKAGTEDDGGAEGEGKRDEDELPRNVLSLKNANVSLFQNTQ